jgi:hypothetical protein
MLIGDIVSWILGDDPFPGVLSLQESKQLPRGIL